MVHVISPYLKYMDAGKTRIDISSFIQIFLEKLNKAIAKKIENLVLAIRG